MHDPSRSNIGHTQTNKREFHTFKTSARFGSPSVIIDGGTCFSVVGKETLDRAMKLLNIDKVEDTTFRLQYRRFGNYNDDQSSLFAVKMPFCSRKPNAHVNVEFDV